MTDQQPPGVPPPPQYQAPYQPPVIVQQKKGPPWGLIIVIVLVLFCVLPIGGIGAITLLGKSVTTTTINTATGAGKTDAAGQPGTGRDKPAPIGTPVSPAKGWTVQVNSAQVNANDTMGSINQFNTPESGKQYTLVNVTIANKSGDV